MGRSWDRVSLCTRPSAPCLRPSSRKTELCCDPSHNRPYFGVMPCVQVGGRGLYVVQGSHTDWKNFYQSGKSQGILCRLEKSGKFGQNTGKGREISIFCVIFNWTVFVKMDQVFRPTWWVSWVVIQFGESWYPAACTCSTSTDSILGLLLTSYTILFGLDGHERTILRWKGLTRPWSISHRSKGTRQVRDWVVSPLSLWASCGLGTN